MKKILVMMLAVLLLVGLCAGCAAPSTGDEDKTPKTDMEYVKDKGTLIVGITDFAPMDYKDADGKWIGFDADMATKFAEKLGVDVEFQVITWGNKIAELDGKTIDVVWNGMTLGEEVLAGMKCSNAYCKNAQVVVVKSSVADNYKTVDSVKSLSFAVEDGSAGEEVIVDLGVSADKITEVEDQATALAEVKAGTSDAAVIDLLMAGAMIGEGTGFADLSYTVGLNSEEYGVGFRKGSDLADELNKFFKETYADGTMMELAKKYGVQESIIEQK